MNRKESTECDSCHWLGPVKRYDFSSLGIRETHLTKGYSNLCSLCASTVTGNTLEYPRQYPNADIMRVICYVGNAIISEIRKLNPKIS